MESGVGIPGDPSRLLNIAPRIATIVSMHDIIMSHDSKYYSEELLLIQVLALILIGVAAGTIGIVSNNEALEAVRDFDVKSAPPAFTELQDLINRSLGAAGWLIVMGVGVLVAEIVATILAIANVQTMKLAIQIIVSEIFGLLGI